MAGENDVIDSPTGWVASHIKQYVETGGKKGHMWRSGAPTLLLTTIGRKSGARRRTALIYGRDGDAYVVVGSKGGSHVHPLWYLNLTEHPEVELQVADQTMRARARTANAEERARLWPEMTRIWPDYDRYQTRTDREIPVVILDPVS
jgi:deazaflavin-dependent oxidoreductase (nitroreductase family)